MLKILSGYGYREQGIISIEVYDKEQYRDCEYVGTYKITYTDYVESWGDDEDWLKRTIEIAQEIERIGY